MIKQIQDTNIMSRGVIIVRHGLIKALDRINIIVNEDR